MMRANEQWKAARAVRRAMVWNHRIASKATLSVRLRNASAPRIRAILEYQKPRQPKSKP